MKTNTARSPDPADAPTASEAKKDLRAFVSALPAMAIAGEYPGDPRLASTKLPTPIRRAILKDEVLEDDIACIDFTKVDEPIAASDVMSALWMHRDYLDRKMVVVHAKSRTADTVEISVRLEPVVSPGGLAAG